MFVKEERYIAVCGLYFVLFIVYAFVCGCGQGADRPPELGLQRASKGYVLYVFADRTEVMIDFSKSDGISRGTVLDVFRMDVPDMDEPVKIGEITVQNVGKKMSKAKIAVITSSLQMERGDRVFPHPIVIISDASWVVSRKPVDGWKSEVSLSSERDWSPCQVLTHRRDMTPEIRQLAADTDVKPIWHPSITSHHGDVFFRRVFHIDAKPTAAEINIMCGGRTNIYLNDQWIGEAKEWPEIDNFKVHTFLKPGRNLIAVHSIIREQRSKAPPVLFLALTIQTKFQ